MRKLLSVWICLLLVVTLCPGAWHTQGKPSGGSKGGKKGDGKKNSAGLGFSNPGLKLSGASAAGMLGGTGLSLGFFGRHKHGSRGHKNPPSERQPPPYYDEQQGSHNRSRWRAIFSSAAPLVFSSAVTHVLPFLTLVWMREI